MATRWGIISAGKISHDFVTALAVLDPKEHQVVAVAARSLSSAQEFAKEHKIPKAYGSYEELIKDPNVEVVYIGATNNTHLPVGKLALNNGKHVLCEKPLCINVRETKELLELARQKNLFLMEAIWSRFFPSYKKLREQIESGAVGEVRQVLVSFGVKIAEVDRLKLKELGGGSILDIGVYCVQFSQWVFGGETPLKIVGAGVMNSQGVDESTSVTLLYSGGRTATFVTNTKVEMPNEAFAVGTKGTLKLNNVFNCSTTLETPSGTLEFPLPQAAKKFNFTNSCGLNYQCHEVRRCIKSGLIESPIVSHKESLQIAEIMESVRKQIGVVYLQD
jgi:dihydrodiol dehydrogenase / D-xylose 1-dehydrogenase (NADP)